MKKILGFLAVTTLMGTMIGCASQPPVQEVAYTTQKVSLSTEMQAISANLQAFQSAENADQANTALTALHSAYERSQYVIPATIDISDSEKVSGYMGDLSKSIKIVEQASSLVKLARLDEAKALVSQLDDIKNHAHKAYR